MCKCVKCKILKNKSRYLGTKIYQPVDFCMNSHMKLLLDSFKFLSNIEKVIYISRKIINIQNA